MNSHCMFNLFIALALMAAILLTVREAAATTDVVSQADSMSLSDSRCADLPSRHSIHAKYIRGMEAWVAYTEDGPAGVDGGLIQLFSDYRICPG